MDSSLLCSLSWWDSDTSRQEVIRQEDQYYTQKNNLQHCWQKPCILTKQIDIVVTKCFIMKQMQNTKKNKVYHQVKTYRTKRKKVEHVSNKRTDWKVDDPVSHMSLCWCCASAPFYMCKMNFMPLPVEFNGKGGSYFTRIQYLLNNRNISRMNLFIIKVTSNVSGQFMLLLVELQLFHKNDHNLCLNWYDVY